VAIAHSTFTAVQCSNDQLLASNGSLTNHIFPAKFLDDRGIDSSASATACSTAALMTATNQRISCSATFHLHGRTARRTGSYAGLVLSSHLSSPWTGVRAWERRTDKRFCSSGPGAHCLSISRVGEA